MKHSMVGAQAAVYCRSMPVHRIYAGVILATSIAVAAEARADCSAGEGCFCPSEAELNTTFSGTIVQGTAASENIQVRIDTLTRVGTWTKLASGSLVSFSVTKDVGTVSDGARIVGVSTTPCPDESMGCDPTKGAETVQLTQIAAADTSFECRGTKLSSTADSLAATMASASCISEIKRLVSEAGADLSCSPAVGSNCSTRPGAAGSGGWAALLGIAALVGRRRRRA